jgi:hypothetical protein
MLEKSTEMMIKSYCYDEILYYMVVIINEGVLKAGIEKYF